MLLLSRGSPPRWPLVVALLLALLGARPLVSAAASPPADAEPLDPADPADLDQLSQQRSRLRAEIAAHQRELLNLRRLAAGDLPHAEDGKSDIDLVAFIGLDLADDAAIASELVKLRVQLAEQSRQLEPPPPPAPPPTPTPDAAELALTPDDLETPAPATQPDPPQPAAAAERPAHAAQQDEVAALTRQLAELDRSLLEARIAVLTLTPAERRALVDADAERTRLRRGALETQAAVRDAAAEARAAEAARQRALDAALAAQTAYQRHLAEQRALAEGVGRDLAQLRGHLAEERHAFERQRRTGDWPGADLLAQIDAVEPGSEAATALYDALVDALTISRDQLRVILRAAEAEPDVPRYRPDPAALRPPSGAPVAERAELLRRAAELEQLAAALSDESRALALDQLDAIFEHESRLYAARIALLDRLPPAKRRAVLGFDREGVAQLQRELDRLVLAVRWYRIQRTNAPNRLLTALSDPYALAGLAAQISWLLLLLLAAYMGQRRGRRDLRGVRSLILRHTKHARAARIFQGVITVLDHLFSELLLLATVLIAGPLLAGAQQIAEVSLLYAILLDYAVYRLLLQIAHQSINALYLRRPGTATSARILASLRLIGRAALAILVFLTISERILGRGYLYRLVLGSAWLGALPIAAVIIRWWRAAIADAYLAYQAQGPVADAVRRTRDRWYGFFVATLALLILLVVASVRLVRRFILGFEQSRKALAFFFRRRLERAEAMHRGEEPSPAELPADLALALRVTPVDEPELLVDFFPGFRDINDHLAAWSAGDRLGAALVIGPAGVGKTTWLRAAGRCFGGDALPATLLRPSARLASEAALLDFIARGLDAPAAASHSRDALIAWLRAGPRRLVLIDDLQRLYLRGVDTRAAWSALSALIIGAGPRVFWICTISRLADEYLRWAARDAAPFRARVELSGWPEEQIAALLRRRTAAAGYTVRYDDLIVDRLEGVESHAQLISTEIEYARLIWDYADGSPAVALESWRSSLVLAEAKRVHVRLFRRPEEAKLEQLTQPQRFILASVVWHHSLTAEEATASLRFGLAACEEALERLRESGVLTKSGPRYRPATTWLPAIGRFLRRNHLIEAL
jgi:hypothetical protein